MGSAFLSTHISVGFSVQRQPTINQMQLNRDYLYNLVLPER
jgi:hypothetical protein